MRYFNGGAEQAVSGAQQDYDLNATIADDPTSLCPPKYAYECGSSGISIASS